MDLPSLLIACSVHADDALLLSIARVHSEGNPLVVLNVNWGAVNSDELDGDDVVADTQTPSSIEAARSAVVRIRALGGEAVLGLLPVRPEWAQEFGKTELDLFDACSNIQVASAKLAELDYACRSKSPRFDAPPRRACTLDRYGASLGLPALRRAVLADLSVGPSLGAEGPMQADRTGDFPPAGDGLFFSITPAHESTVPQTAASPTPSHDSLAPIFFRTD